MVTSTASIRDHARAGPGATLEDYVSLQGTIETFAIADVLRLLAATDKTGRLQIQSTLRAGTVWVAEGQILAAESSTPAEGTVEVLFNLLRFERGSFRFELDRPPPTLGDPTGIELALGDAESMLAEWRELCKTVPSPQSWLSLRSELDGDSVTVTADQWRLVAAVGSGATVASVSSALDLHELDGMRAANGVLTAGLVNVGEAPPAVEVTDEKLPEPPRVEFEPSSDPEAARRLDEVGTVPTGNERTNGHSAPALAGALAPPAPPAPPVIIDPEARRGDSGLDLPPPIAAPPPPAPMASSAPFVPAYSDSTAVAAPAEAESESEPATLVEIGEALSVEAGAADPIVEEAPVAEALVIEAPMIEAVVSEAVVSEAAAPVLAVEPPPVIEAPPAVQPSAWPAPGADAPVDYGQPVTEYPPAGFDYGQAPPPEAYGYPPAGFGYGQPPAPGYDYSQTGQDYAQPAFDYGQPGYGQPPAAPGGYDYGLPVEADLTVSTAVPTPAVSEGGYSYGTTEAPEQVETEVPAAPVAAAADVVEAASPEAESPEAESPEAETIAAESSAPDSALDGTNIIGGVPFAVPEASPLLPIGSGTATETDTDSGAATTPVWGENGAVNAAALAPLAAFEAPPEAFNPGAAWQEATTPERLAPPPPPPPPLESPAQYLSDSPVLTASAPSLSADAADDEAANIERQLFNLSERAREAVRRSSGLFDGRPRR